MRIAVTGGSGFLGSYILKELSGHEISVIDIREGTDIRDKRAVGRALEGADAVIHAAALTSVTESMQKKEEYFDVNVRGTVNLLETAEEKSVEKFVFISSAAVYGDPKTMPVSEDTPLDPLSPYAESKVLGEKEVKSGKIEWSIVRPFNIYGMGQPNNDYAGVITKFLSNAKAGRPLTVFGDGEQTRDFVNVEDVARAVRIVMEKGEKAAYNVGTGKETSVNKLAQIFSELGDVEIVHAPERQGEIRKSVADISRIQALGFSPRIGLNKGIGRMWEAYC